MLDQAEVQSVAPVRHRRVCPWCGKAFLPDDASGRKIFCCACCAWAHLQADESQKIDRMMRVGDRVILLSDGRAGVLASARTVDDAVVRIGNELIRVGPSAVERVQGLPITHTCGKGRNPFAVAKKEADDGREVEDAGVVPSSATAGRADRLDQHS
jgi:hypothetical protein